MSLSVRVPLSRLALGLITALALSGPALAEKSIDRVFGGIEAERGQEYGSLETVNGGIRIRDGARVRSAETVNGGIRIGNDADVGDAETVNGGIRVGSGSRVRSVETVNGGITLDSGAQIADDAATVNGGIRAERQVRIGGNVETVNGTIDLTATAVGGGIETTNGDIRLDAGTTIEGGLRVRKPQSLWWSSNRSRDPRVVLGPDVVVKGPLVFEREVELRIHPSAKHGPISGATAKPLDGDTALERD